MNQEQEKEPSHIAGIVLIVVARSDLNRVIERLHVLFNINAASYCGPMTTMGIDNWERFVTGAMIYLELEHEAWSRVIYWLSGAERAGLVARYHYAEIGKMYCSENEPGQE